MATRQSSLTPLHLLLFAAVCVTSLASTAEVTPAARHAVPGLAGGGEFELDSVASRRLLQAWGSISYDALQRDSIPCSRRGASYYNCRPGAEANPYDRGCSAITQCRR